MKTCHFDTETLGLYGPMAIGQFKFNYETSNHKADEKFIFDPWHQPIDLTIQLIEELVECRVVAHNLTFDWQKISQFYCAIKALKFAEDGTVRPIDHIDSMARMLYEHRSDYCLKPAAAVCTLLLCQKKLGGTSLAAKEVRVRKVPQAVAQVVADCLNKHTHLPDILFANRNTDVRWAPSENEEDGDAWMDVVLKFGASNSLKDIARLVFGDDDTIKIGEEVQPPRFPYELGYVPYAVLLDEGGWMATPRATKDNPSPDQQPLWPLLLKAHVDFWTTDEVARLYALKDVDMLVRLDEYLGSIESDFDSELACQVASVRVAGLEIDLEKLKEQNRASLHITKSAKLNVDSHIQVRDYIEGALDPMERHVCAESCDADTLKRISKTFFAEEREDCCDKGCERCDFKTYIPIGPYPVVGRAKHVLKIRKHRKRRQLYKKLWKAKSAFPSFRVYGAKSGRMSGADGLNYHGIDGSPEIREIFTFAQQGWVVCGGDMNSQELAIAAAVMNDDNLSEVLRSGKKLHAIFAADASGLSYEQIMAKCTQKGTPEAFWYGKGKVCAYAILYGASAYKIAADLGCSVEEAAEKIAKFFAQFPWMAEKRKLVKKSLEALTQDENGRLVIVKPKQTYIDSCFGFRRSFDTEYAVMEIMIATMNEVKGALKDYPGKVIRKEEKGVQTLASAVSSALFGATFSLQGKVLRAALNHVIQSAGRTITLRVQKAIWDKVQPEGIHPFQLKLLSVHDEIATASPTEHIPAIREAVCEEMAELCKTVPLLSIDWAEDVGSWYGIKSTEDGLVRAGWEG